ncbi:MAG: biopolymer transporter ExbD [Opitutales bacterium]|nr:biopolymer transporter ExbD [Opitutales bacterium]
MRLKKKQRPAEAFQMAPMIDMVFLLLVFFMTVGTLAQADRTVELDLPESEESRVPEDLSGRGIISVREDGAIFLGGNEVTLAEMQARIGSEIRRNPELRVQVRADAGTPFREIRRILNACAEEGAFDVIYSTYQPY